MTAMSSWPGQKLLTELLRRFREPGTRQMTPRELADHGENLAATHLRRGGLKIIARNFRCDSGEIDIIARDGKTLVFVEVKTRESSEESPEAAVDFTKRQRVTAAATIYLSRYGANQPSVRFDVVAIVWPKGRQPRINHMPAAFQAEERKKS